ncbi:ATP-binding cassette domain-containing protein [candidate division KSB1 bacterium]|nr:ATP-binding cassette domain-containing protein [candidate division KSB1 bacterium]
MAQSTGWQALRRLRQRLLQSRYPVVRQYDRIDCGPAALLSVLKYYGGDANLVTVRNTCQTDIQGTTMYDLVQTAEGMGFEAVGATGEYDELKKEQMPCIAHVVLPDGLQHYVVIYAIDDTELKVGDPAKGLIRMSRPEFEELWKQKAVVLLDPQKPLWQHSQTGWISWIWQFVQKQESWVLQTLFLGLLATALGLMTAVFVQLLLDRFIPDKQTDMIVITGGMLLLLIMIRSVAGYVRQRFLIEVNKRINIDINAEFLSHIFRIPKRFFDTRKMGDITSRINDSMRIQQAILLLTNTTLIDGMIVLGSFVMLFVMAPLLAWVSLAILPLYGIYLSSRTKQIKSEQHQVMSDHAQVESSYIDSLRGIDEIMGFSVGNAFTLLNRELFKRYQGSVETLGKTQARLSFAAESSGGLFTIALLTIGALAVIKGHLMLGQMMAAYSLASNMLPSINRFVQAHISLQGASRAAERLRDILLVKKQDNPGKRPFMLSQAVCIRQGAFRWPKGEPLFNDMNMEIRKGRLTALWGPSGSGKSTLVQILQRKYDLLQGDVFIDDMPAQEIDLEEYRRSMSVIPQQIRIFNGTLLENIVLGRQISALSEVQQRIDSLGLMKFIQRFQQGLFTLLGEDGRQLSGGETQVLALIRALFDYPDVVIVDEGFSAIDVDIEELVFTTLKSYSKDHAVMIITHNVATLLRTDWIYLLQDKQIVEQGDPHTLLNHKSRFQRLVRHSAMGQMAFYLKQKEA